MHIQLNQRPLIELQTPDKVVNHRYLSSTTGPQLDHRPSARPSYLSSTMVEMRSITTTFTCVSCPAQLCFNQERLKARGSAHLQDRGVGHAILRMDVSDPAKASNMECFELPYAFFLYSVHVSQSYRREDKTTALWTLTFVVSFMSWLFQRRFVKRPNATLALDR